MDAVLHCTVRMLCCTERTVLYGDVRCAVLYESRAVLYGRCGALYERYAFRYAAMYCKSAVLHCLNAVLCTLFLFLLGGVT